MFVGRLAADKGLDVLLQALGKAVTRLHGGGRMGLPQQISRVSLATSDSATRASRGGSAMTTSTTFSLRLVTWWSRHSRKRRLRCPALEALAAGCPLLVSDRGALPEFVGDGRGLVSHAGDVGDLAAKLVQLVDDDEFCRAASEEALSFARHSLDPERHLAHLESVYGALSA